MISGSKNKLENNNQMNITVDTEIVERVSEFKYLGMVLEEPHIQDTYKKGCSKIGAIKNKNVWQKRQFIQNVCCRIILS